MAEAVVWGGGGREAELARVLGVSNEVTRSYLPHSHAGARVLKNVENLPKEVNDFGSLATLALERDVLVIIGPEAPLIAGKADELRAKGVRTFGLSQKAARLEGSKAFGVEGMRRWGILHPDTFIAYKPEDALDYIATHAARGLVIKADGEALGKGAILEDDNTRAQTIVRDMLSGEKFGDAGKTILFQDRWKAPDGKPVKEITGVAVCDGKNHALLPVAQDYKRRDEGDKGPNTGGMGAYAPVPSSVVPQKHIDSLHEIVERVMHGMAKDYDELVQGALYIGAAENEEGELGVLEFNGRFGDPETEVTMPVMEAAGIDTYNLLSSAAEGRLDPNLTIPQEIGFIAVTFCLAVPGYPDNPRKGQVIHGLEEKYEDVILHLAGVTFDNGRYITSGGRAIYVTAKDEQGDINRAAGKALAVIGYGGVRFEDMHFRPDIGWQVRKRSQKYSQGQLHGH